MRTWRRHRRVPAFVFLVAVAVATITAPAGAEDGDGGVTVRREGAFPGYTLIAPSESETTYLVDLDGDVVHRWEAGARPGLQVELLENGQLLRPAKTARDTPFSEGNGWGGTIQLLDRDGDAAWTYEYASDEHLQHHDVELLPNGHILLLAWERVGKREAVAAGRDPRLIRDGSLWSEHIVEVDPATDEIVWQWHAWDHLVQDHDPTKPDYGDPSEHPGR